MRKKLFVVLLTLAVLVTVTFALHFFLITLENANDAKMISEGNGIVSRIQTYYADNGHLPVHLAEIGVPEKEEGPFYYDRREGGFILWYGKSVGESMTYHSQTKSWRDED